MNTVTLDLANSTLYLRWSTNQQYRRSCARTRKSNASRDSGAGVESPVAEARLQGTLDDWRALRYQMNITSSVDLTQLSDTLQTGATLRGVGNFSGTVTGEGDQFNSRAEIKSDALAADGVRLQGLNVTANGIRVRARVTRLTAKLLLTCSTSGDFRDRFIAARRQSDGYRHQFPLGWRASSGRRKELRHNDDGPDPSRRARRNERGSFDGRLKSVYCKRTRRFWRQSGRHNCFGSAECEARTTSPLRTVASVKAGQLGFGRPGKGSHGE